MCPTDAARIANSVDPDQTAPLVVVWSGSALFAQTCLSENLWAIPQTFFKNHAEARSNMETQSDIIGKPPDVY